MNMVPDVPADDDVLVMSHVTRFCCYLADRLRAIVILLNIFSVQQRELDKSEISLSRNKKYVFDVNENYYFCLRRLVVRFSD